MNISKLGLIVILIFVFACDKSDDEPNDNLPCFECESEHNVDTLIDYTAKVIKVWHDPINGIESSYAISIEQKYLNETTYALSKDSILIICPYIPKKYKIANKLIKITGYTKNCNELLGCPDCRFRYGRKFDLISIVEL